MFGKMEPMRTVANYRIERGEHWERLIIIKDRRTRRKRVPTEAAASMLVGETKYVIPCKITSEGGVELVLTAENTEWLADGQYPWDMVATVSRSALLTHTPLTETVTTRGTLTVTTYANITPMGSDGSLTPLVEVS